MPPKVSVVIPTYNRSKLLKKAIKSVLDQTFKDFEVLVVDNASQDDTKEMIASLKDPRIKVCGIQNHGVIARSRNHGMRNAAGEYIAFLDDDDLWLPDKLEKQVSYLETHPEYHLVYTPVWTTDENDVRKELLEIRRSPAEGDLFYELVRGNYIAQTTVLMRRGLLSEIGSFNEDPAYRSIEDYEYWLRVSLKRGIGFIGEPLALYRVHSGGISKSVNESALNQMVLKKFLGEPGIRNKKPIEERINSLYCKSAIYRWRTRDKTAARKDLWEYVKWSAKKQKAGNIFKAAALYFALASGLYRFFLGHPKHFRRIF